MRFLIFSFIFSLTIYCLQARSSNSYGDEQVLPEGGGADMSANNAPEQDAQKVSQPSSGSNAKTVASGYRRRRRNAYGDEMVVPAGGGAQSYDSAVEQSPEAVQQQSAASQPEVTHSGYRVKRNNQYGDEQITPVGGGAQSFQSNVAAEQAPETVHQNTQIVESSVHSSGY